MVCSVNDLSRIVPPVVVYWLRVFSLIGLVCKVLGLLILLLSPEPIYGPLSLGAKMTGVAPE